MQTIGTAVDIDSRTSAKDKPDTRGMPGWV